MFEIDKQYQYMCNKQWLPLLTPILKKKPTGTPVRLQFQVIKHKWIKFISK